MNFDQMQPSIYELFIVDQVNRINRFVSQYGDSIDKEKSLNEFRTFIVSGVRASGATTACARLFDPKKDVYVAYAYEQVKLFNNLLYDNGVVKTKTISFNYSTCARENSNIIDKQTQLLFYNKIINYTLNNTDIKPFTPYKQIIKSILKSHSFIFPNSLRGKTIKSDAIYWFDMGCNMTKQKMNWINEFIQIADLHIQADGTQKYIIL